MNNSNKKIIWDLFGGGQNSVFLTLKENNKLNEYDVYTFDITEPIHEKQFKLDLSQENIIEIFKQFPTPHIIVASPLCQSFSCVLNMKGGGTCFWKLNSNGDKLIERSVKEFEKLKSGFTKNLKADVQLFIKRLGKKCIDNTIDLIKYYKPKVWYIENPKQSLIWKYIKLNRKDFYNDSMFLNEASYGKYGFLTTKSTYFLSNINMNFKKGKIDPPYRIEIIDGIKYYVLKDDNETKLRYDLDSRMLGIASINKMIKARNVNSGLGAMDFIQRNKTPIQKNKKSNEQICEAGPASAIPHLLIKNIFSYFEHFLDEKNLINLIELINNNEKIDEIKIHKILFIIYGKFNKKFSIDLFEPKFEAWKYGPVEIDYRDSNANNILNKKFILKINSNEQFNYLIKIIKKVLSYDVNQLISYTHKNYAWSINYRNDIKHIKIEKNQIIESFNMKY